MNRLDKNSSLQNVLDKLVDNKKIFGTSFALKKGGEVWLGASGDISPDQPYFIASTTKLFTAAIILRLRSEGKLQLDDKISRYLNRSVISGLHLFKGKDYSDELTIKHLLAHTSGLPDYFQGKGANGKSLEKTITDGNDQSWSFEEVMERTKAMKALFIPGAKKKASYSDSNFQLLGRIIEVISNKAYSDNCTDLVTGPLGLSGTYLYQDVTDTTPKTLYYKSKPLIIPRAMASFGADGGIVSTSSELLLFIEAFFTGKLFPGEYIDELQKWNKIFFPMRAGIGIQLFKLPWFLNPTGAVPSFQGHSGLSGAVAYCSPKEGIYVAGTTNQIAHPETSFKTMIKLTQTLKKNLS